MYALILAISIGSNTFDYKEFLDAPWGDVVIAGGKAHLCYGFPTIDRPLNVKCVQLDDQKAYKCKHAGRNNGRVYCNKDI